MSWYQFLTIWVVSFLGLATVAGMAGYPLVSTALAALAGGAAARFFTDENQ